jgi:7,8-dihydropterin-6-yl-methyl-4-(beta-D-ribofuranosyl)aminobenzene 5'-phosphate synthase
VEKIHAIMGGFHLTGKFFEPIIEPTIQELEEINPDFILPTHCTGRKAMARIEAAMPDKFLLNMSGTKVTFSA